MTALGTALITALVAFFAPLFDSPRPLVHVWNRPSAEIIFGGDLMFDRSVRVAMQEHGDDHVLSCIASILRDADLVVANLEGPVTSNASMSVGSIVGSPENFTFTFATSTAALLRRHNIALVNLGNNHILNFGQDGVTQTKKWLDAAGVAYFGDPQGSETDRVGRVDIDGIKFSFISWSDWTGGEKPEVIAQIEAEKSAGRLPVVYTHWGDEYVPPSDRIRSLGHAFVDAGAVIVIGSHPHVVLEHEIYKDVPIYYSLGNLVFDQYFSEEVRNGLMLRVVFDAKGIASIMPIPTILERDRRTCIRET